MSGSGRIEPPGTDGFPATVVPSPTGALLSIRSRAAKPPARAVLCLLHDAAEHAGRYAAAASTLADAGVEVLAHDHRGHGATAAADAPPGVLAAKDGFDRAVEDAVFVAERARASHRGLPLVTLGLGFGGLVALGQAVTRPDLADGVAVWSADVDGRAHGPARKTGLGGLLAPRKPSPRVWAALRESWSKAMLSDKTGYGWLSRDGAQVDRYRDDPLCGRPPSPSFWRDLFDGVARLADDRAFGATPRATPIHLLAGAGDPATANADSIAAFDVRLRDLGFLDVARVILPDARHAILHDPAGPEVLRLLQRWIERVAAGQASHA